MASPVPTYNSTVIGYLDLAGLDLPITLTQADMKYPGSTISVLVTPEGKVVELVNKLPMEGTGAAKIIRDVFASFGGALDETNSYRNEPWEYASMQEMVGEDRELLVFGITNDQVGYILTDNDYSSIISGVNEEIVATGDKAGSTTIVAFEELIESIR